MLELDSVHCHDSFYWVVFLSQYAPYNSENLVWLKYLSNKDVISIDAKFLREYVLGQAITNTNNLLDPVPITGKIYLPP